MTLYEVMTPSGIIYAGGRSLTQLIERIFFLLPAL